MKMTPRPRPATLLIVNSDPSHLDAFRVLLAEATADLRTATSAAEAIREAREARPDVVILETPLPDMTGMEAIQGIRDVAGAIPMIFVGENDPHSAIEAIKRGAYDYLAKPLSGPHVREVVANALQVSRLPCFPVVPPEGPEAPADGTIVGRSPAMQEIYKAIGRIAPRDFTVLIVGESGTGKELVARALHQHSPRARGPFLAINCAALPEGILESELFGHEKGAFTGAGRQRIGKFEQANGGTLFLDEVGDMAPLTQAKVLRVLQEQQFERVGGTEPIRADVRVLAATNRDLNAMVSTAQFRLDLFYRLSVCAIALPPLRERKTDLSLLVEHFLRRFSRELDKGVVRASPKALALLEQHSWPGNLRELQSVLRQALLVAHGPILLPEFLPSFLTGGQKVAWPDPSSRCLERFIRRQLERGTSTLYADAQKEMDRLLLEEAMRHTKGNQRRAAQLLGVTRARLRTKLRALGLPTTRAGWSILDPFSIG
jgi:two-component system nitrogen regulation response regulator GlnG